MIRIYIIIIVLTCLPLIAEESVYLGFLVNPEFSKETIKHENFSDRLEVKLDSLIDDTLSYEYRKFLLGNLTEFAYSDSADNYSNMVFNSSEFDYYSPTNYSFRPDSNGIRYKIFSANLKSDLFEIKKYDKVTTDSISVGFFSIYSPDISVYAGIDSTAEICMFIEDVIEENLENLKDCDIKIAISALSKYVDKKIFEDKDIDAIISFDYKGTKNTEINDGKTQFISLKSSENEFGVLKIHGNRDDIKVDWQEFIIDVQ